MAAELIPVAAATAALGYDMLSNSELRQTKRRRKIIGAALAGSAAGGDSAVELKDGGTLLARLYNLATGLPTRDHMVPVGKWVDAPGELNAKVIDAAATNALNLLLITSD